MTQHEARLEKMTAAWLLPIVATIVAAATGGVVAEVMPDPQQALITVIVSYVLWSTGIPLAFCVLTVYFLRLTTYNLPPREVIVSTFLPLGPLGQGGFAVMQLGKVVDKLFKDTESFPTIGPSVAGEMLYMIGFFVAIVFWGFGLVWLFFALASIHNASHFPFVRISHLPSAALSFYEHRLTLSRIWAGGDSLSRSVCTPSAQLLWAKNSHRHSFES